MNIPKEDIHYIDLPGLSETFADSFHTSVFDGQNLRIEFCVTRMDDVGPSAKPTARQYPSCRLVLDRNGTLALYDHLHQLIATLKQKGAIKTTEPEKDIMH